MHSLLSTKMQYAVTAMTVTAANARKSPTGTEAVMPNTSSTNDMKGWSLRYFPTLLFKSSAI